MPVVPDIEFAGLLDISRAIAAREISSAEVTGHLLARIDAAEPSLHSLASVCREGARAAAAQADAELAAGFHRGPLHGVPIAVKDLLATKGHVTASGTRIFADWIPQEDATAVTRLRRAGAVIIAKAQMTEAATIAHHPDIATPINPWGGDRCAGFSSSGSGVSVAAGLCYAALGSDTGGSIRIPSAMNGVTGLKPTWGRVSRHGVFPLVEYLDTIGPLARSAADAAAVLGAIAGADPKDPTAAPVPVPDYLATINGGVSGIRIGIDLSALEDGCDKRVADAVASAAAILADLGADMRAVRLPAWDIMAMFPLMSIGIGEAHRGLYPERAGDYGPALRAMLDQAHAIGGIDAAAAINLSNAMKGGLAGLFAQVDLLLVPALTRPTPKAGELERAMGETPADVMDVMRFTVPFNISGHPTITLQGGIDEDGMPIGFQLVGRPFAEALLFQAGHAFQTVTDWHVRHPSVK